MTNLANSYGIVGRKQEALKPSQQALDMQKRVLGEDHLDAIHPILLQLLLLQALGTTEQLRALLRLHCQLTRRCWASITRIRYGSRRHLEWNWDYYEQHSASFCYMRRLMLLLPALSLFPFTASAVFKLTKVYSSQISTLIVLRE